MSDELKILLVDDDEFSIFAFKREMQTMGFFNEILTAKKIEEGLALAPECDLVVLDVMLMPHNGIDFIKAFKEKSKSPVFIYSGVADEVRKEAFEKGADWVLQKPLDALNFISAILSLNIGTIQLLRKPEEVSSE